jgi:hypothetical protein
MKASRWLLLGLTLATLPLLGCASGPKGVPGQATLVWFGKADKPDSLRNVMPDIQPGQIYIYDETEKRLLLVRSVWQDHHDLNFQPDPTHQYRIYFLPTPD